MDSCCFSAALATDEQAAAAADRVVRAAREQLGAAPDLGLLFASSQHVSALGPIASRVQEALGCRVLLGASGESIVGDQREIEGQPAMSLWLAHLPGVRLAPLRLQFARTAEGGTFVGWPDDIDCHWGDARALLLLGDPFSFPADALVERLNEDRPGVPVHGGLASSAHEPGGNRLVLGSEVHASGAVGVLLSGAVRVRSVVSQGCRPIGRPLVVTKAQRNALLELAGRPALDYLRELWPTLEPREQQLVQHGLHVGLVTNEYQDRFERGDFLVRNVIGIDPERGAVAIGDYARVGQTVQFQVRDGQTADEDLRELLRRALDRPAAGPRGALVFTCNGRGTRLFEAPHHDAAAVWEATGGAPAAGFFAQGELGPVAGKNFLHGFTASVAILESEE